MAKANSSAVWTPSWGSGSAANPTFQGSPGGASGGSGQDPNATNLTNQPFNSWIDPNLVTAARPI
jgi:hypothetical protein